MSFFVAVDLDAPVRAVVSALVERHAATTPAKWLRSDKFHVTLQYLGHPKPEALAALQPKLSELAKRHAPFSLSLAQAGLFTTRRAPAVLWLGVAGALEALSALQRDVAAAAGTPPDDKPFIPHVTLGRGESRPAFEAIAAELETFTSPAFTVSGLVLYESNDHVYRRVFSTALGS